MWSQTHGQNHLLEVELGQTPAALTTDSAQIINITTWLWGSVLSRLSSYVTILIMPYFIMIANIIDHRPTPSLSTVFENKSVRVIPFAKAPRGTAWTHFLCLTLDPPLIFGKPSTS